VLVIGATGGVGSFFVQFAGETGAQLIAPALPEDEGYLRELGVTELLDRNAELDTTVRQRHPDGVDAILDLVNFTPRERLLTEDGRLASPLGAPGEGAQRFNLMAQPTPDNLQRLADRIEAARSVSTSMRHTTLHTPARHSNTSPNATHRARSGSPSTDGIVNDLGQAALKPSAPVSTASAHAWRRNLGDASCKATRTRCAGMQYGGMRQDASVPLRYHGSFRDLR
jgi:NAD(P)-dependent dehydrogenase (short-subunit alcohol dehydrogenase family)